MYILYQESTLLSGNKKSTPVLWRKGTVVTCNLLPSNKTANTSHLPSVTDIQSLTPAGSVLLSYEYSVLLIVSVVGIIGL